MMQVIAMKVPNESGYMICFTGVICFLHGHFLH